MTSVIFRLSDLDDRSKNVFPSQISSFPVVLNTLKSEISECSVVLNTSLGSAEGGREQQRERESSGGRERAAEEDPCSGFPFLR